jgi:O-antigen ligase
MNLAYYGGFNKLHEQGFGGMDNNCMAIQFVAAVGFIYFLGFAATAWWQRGLAIVGAGLMLNAIMFSFSRGGLLSLVITGCAAFFLVPKRTVHYLAFAAAVVISVRLAGKEVLERLSTSFAQTENLDTSASSRLELWGNCRDLMFREPLLGVGPDHFGYYAHIDFGWPLGKEAHSLWFQTGAELGLVGLALLALFYLSCIWKLWPLTRESSPIQDPRVRDMARMVIASIIGFMVAAQFVSLEGLEFPYYVVLVGAGTLKVVHQPELIEAHAPVLEPALLQHESLALR